MNEHNDPRCLKWGEGRAPRKARIWRVYNAVKRLGEMSELSTTEWGSTQQLHLSARAYHRVLKLARTITANHVAEAVQYRPRVGM